MNILSLKRLFPALIFFVVLSQSMSSLFAQDDKDAGALLSGAVQTLDSAQKEMNAAVGEYNAALENQEQAMEEFEAQMNDQGDPRVMIRLTYPVGKSPKVFTKGWVFGAEVLFNPNPEDNDAEPEDLSDAVRWEGSGSFNPVKGKQSRPTFSGEGDNTMILSVEIEGKKISKTFHVNAVSPAQYARLGSQAMSSTDSHGCLSCPHTVMGPVQTGSTLVMINGKPAARVGDVGIHVMCCGANSFAIAQGDPEVLIDGKPAARLGDATKHCGGMGKIINIEPR